jgi:cell migration-inducing and hyaluronan-binding protein
MRMCGLRRLDLSRLRLIGVSVLLIGLLLPIRGFAAITIATCDGAAHPLPAGNATTDLEVTGPCEVKAGTYTFRNVNIYRKAGAATGGGALTFDDANTNFFAESIVVENHGSLIAGSSTAPIGANGVVTIHLWGAAGDHGATCKSDNECGVPDPIWSSNPAPSMINPVLNPASCNPTSVLPGNVTNECFYAYDTLDDADMAVKRKAYFGHKVLALSYGGTLQLFGKKGATYCASFPCPDKDPALSPSNTGTSWLRLNGSLKPGATSLTVTGAVDWQDGDHIVVTTTDYLPGHSEELVINGAPMVGTNTTTFSFTNADGITTGVKWPHNGQVYDYTNVVPQRLGLSKTVAETRAAVALLTRSIRIVSEGDTPVANSFPPSPTDNSVGYYFGGHTIVRQGFASYQVQGVEFQQLGQGGAIMHYPVHFHLARRTPQPAKGLPALTFVKDSSIHDSMTRWITLHGSQGVLLARNVGYLSIGHGFYLEDGTETDNRFYANLGIFARAAVDNTQNPRKVPGILTHNNTNTGIPGFDDFPYYSDSNHPSVFWITNGQNDFEYNHAAGAGTCGACYWFVPAAISGASRTEHWFRYAGEQEGANRAGITPLQTFLGNSCSSAMNAFQVNSDTATCNGVNFQPQPAQPNTTLVMLPSDSATKHFPKGGPLPDDLYWPIVTGGHKPTRCPAADKIPQDPDSECSAVKICSNGDESNCDVTTLDQFTTSFDWAQQNFAAIWLRPLWALVINSVVSDVQNGGLNFVTSGDFSKSSVINGFWALARRTVFIGSTQTDNPLASNAGPFNPFVSSDKKVKGLSCATDPNNPVYNSLYCLSKDEGVSIQLSNFSDFQRFFSVYDGPAYQDSNAYLNIHPTYLTSDGTAKGDVIGGCKPDLNAGNPCVNSGFMNAGLAGLRADQLNQRCYFPNAGIGWKQPNGFYYSPAFHSTNLFFGGVDIRHFVTEPLFLQGTFDTNVPSLKQEYCYWAPTKQPGTFTGFTDIDRETVLNDDDGTLTGLTSSVNIPVPARTPATVSETISVNKESFFKAPICTYECASDAPSNPTASAKLPPNTADTSPYEYVTTAIYPECALSVPDSKLVVRYCADKNWGSGCTTSDPAQPNYCVGIPLFRQFLTDGETAGLDQQKRMMGQDTFQRSGLTANHGSYYIDTTVSQATQGANHQNAAGFSPNAFVGGHKYDLFFLFAKKTTAQTYSMYVGMNQPADFGTTNVKFGYVDITTAKYTFKAVNEGKPKEEGKLPTGWSSVYSPSGAQNGILTLKVDMKALADDFDLTKPAANPLGKELCQPSSMCAWKIDGKNNTCQCNINDPTNYLFDACHEKNAAGNDAICSWSTKDIDCPARGCPALQITLPSGFKPDDAADHHRPPPALFSFDPNYETNWNVPFVNSLVDTASQQCLYTGTPVSCLTP